MSSSEKPSRRGMLAVFGLTGAAAATLTLLPGQKDNLPVAENLPKPAPAKGGGYELSEHVKRYYQTTLL